MNGLWSHLLLAVLLLGQLVLLSSQEESRGSLLEGLMLSALGPVAHTVDAAGEAVRGFAAHLRLGRQLREENRRLRREMEAMRRQLVGLQGVEEELEQLSRLSDYTRFDSKSFLVADVVYIDRASWLRTLVIYTGSEPTQRNQPVVTSQGLVGRIIAGAERYAKVLLVTDRSASVSAMILRTRRRGMVRGGGGEELILDNIPLLADVRLGDRVVTAGIDGVFPRGIPIGEVISKQEGQGLFHRLRVAPAIDFGVLDQVYVLTEEVVPGEIKELFYGESDRR